MYEQAQRGGGGAGGFDPSQWNANFGGGAGGRTGQLSHHDARRDARPVRQRRSRSPISSTRFSRAAASPRCAAAAGARARAPRARQGRDVEHPLDLVARGCLPGHDPAPVVPARRPVAQRRRENSRRSGRRFARPCLGRRRARRRRRRVRRSLPSHPHDAGHPIRAEGTGSACEGARSGHDGGARRRGRGAEPGGKPIRLRIPPGTQNGQVFRLKGKGMPIVGKPNEFGDLYATVEAELPRAADPRRARALRGARKAGGRQKRRLRNSSPPSRRDWKQRI